MTTVYPNEVADLYWGTSRKWNAWVEFHVGATMVASSANSDFALMSGSVTEDIGRAIRRDAQVSILFPSNPRRRTWPVLRVLEGTEFTVGESSVGGTDILGGSGEALDVPSQLTDSARNAHVPTQLGDTLDPHSRAEMWVWAGFVGEELLLGIFDLAETTVTAEGGGSVVQVTAHSFERRLDRAGFWQMEGFDASTNMALAVSILVYEVLPGTYVTYPANAATIGELTWGSGDNRMSKITEMMGIAGLEGGFDRQNQFAMIQAPTTSDFGTAAPRWRLVDGVNARVATLNGAGRKFSDVDSYNGVVVEGTGQTDPGAVPAYAVRWNTNPSSPLYYDPANPVASGMGPRVKHISSELVKTNEDALTMASVELAKVQMYTDSIDVEVPANTALEMGQYAHLVCDSLGVDAVYRINRVKHDLGGDAATLSLYRLSSV